ncbi:hypothetical protein COW36_09830 [bacterium (Candidatus Blackallbacteria) CG17_big_fil_post_rev_8_21_14_2_50_48_46]|uniref:Uncharacterized protein n=1 Tax=bacterium (Candidatus Blackallbacteria) CG17_big_fil_post_rev_8_21_14_2_50_48_46 TaxID=2014261 RepID=A0A2M7G598_9BACT
MTTHQPYLALTEIGFDKDWSMCLNDLPFTGTAIEWDDEEAEEEDGAIFRHIQVINGEAVKLLLYNYKGVLIEEHDAPFLIDETYFNPFQFGSFRKKWYETGEPKEILAPVQSSEAINISIQKGGLKKQDLDPFDIIYIEFYKNSQLKQLILKNYIRMHSYEKENIKKFLFHIQSFDFFGPQYSIKQIKEWYETGQLKSEKIEEYSYLVWERQFSENGELLSEYQIDPQSETYQTIQNLKENKIDYIFSDLENYFGILRHKLNGDKGLYYYKDQPFSGFDLEIQSNYQTRIQYMNGVKQGYQGFIDNKYESITHAATKAQSYYVFELSTNFKSKYLFTEKYEFGILLYRHHRDKQGVWLENFELSPDSPDYQRLERYRQWKRFEASFASHSTAQPNTEQNSSPLTHRQIFLEQVEFTQENLFYFNGEAFTGTVVENMEPELAFTTQNQEKEFFRHYKIEKGKVKSVKTFNLMGVVLSEKWNVFVSGIHNQKPHLFALSSLIRNASGMLIFLTFSIIDAIDLPKNEFVRETVQNYPFDLYDRVELRFGEKGKLEFETLSKSAPYLYDFDGPASQKIKVFSGYGHQAFDLPVPYHSFKSWFPNGQLRTESIKKYNVCLLERSFDEKGQLIAEKKLDPESHQNLYIQQMQADEMPFIFPKTYLLVDIPITNLVFHKNICYHQGEPFRVIQKINFKSLRVSFVAV